MAETNSLLNCRTGYTVPGVRIPHSLHRANLRNKVGFLFLDGSNLQTWGMRSPGFEIDRREIREGKCGMVARTSNPHSLHRANLRNKVDFLFLACFKNFNGLL